MKKKKILSLALSFLMVFCLIPAAPLMSFSTVYAKDMNIGSYVFDISGGSVTKNWDDDDEEAMDITLTYLDTIHRIDMDGMETDRWIDLDRDGKKDILVKWDMVNGTSTYSPAPERSMNYYVVSLTDADKKALEEAWEDFPYYETITFILSEDNCGMHGEDRLHLVVDSCATTSQNGQYHFACTDCSYTEPGGIIYRIASWNFAQNTYAYTGTPRKPAPIVKDSKGKVIDEYYYTVSYKNNTAIGTATATIKFRIKYKGTVTKTFKIAPAKMAAPTVTNAAKGFKISWTTQPKGAGGYQIWRKIGTGKYQKIATIKDPSKRSYTDSSEAANKNGVKYAYKIRAYKTVSGTDYLGVISAEKVSYKVAKPAAPTVTNSGVGKITVKWAKNAKASGYKIKYVTGTTTKIAEVKGADITGIPLTVKQGAAYKVYVQAYKTVSGKTYHSCFSPAKSITTNKFIKYKTTGKVNYRTAPGLNTTVKGSIPQGTTVQAVSSYSKVVNNVTWKKIFYKNAFYYVASGYLKKV